MSDEFKDSTKVFASDAILATYVLKVRDEQKEESEKRYQFLTLAAQRMVQMGNEAIDWRDAVQRTTEQAEALLEQLTKYKERFGEMDG